LGFALTFYDAFVSSLPSHHGCVGEHMDGDAPFGSVLGAVMYLSEIVVVLEVPHTKLPTSISV
jgi:hypothetical protein